MNKLMYYSMSDVKNVFYINDFGYCLSYLKVGFRYFKFILFFIN